MQTHLSGETTGGFGDRGQGPGPSVGSPVSWAPVRICPVGRAELRKDLRREERTSSQLDRRVTVLCVYWMNEWVSHWCLTEEFECEITIARSLVKLFSLWSQQFRECICILKVTLKNKDLDLDGTQLQGVLSCLVCSVCEVSPPLMSSCYDIFGAGKRLGARRLLGTSCEPGTLEEWVLLWYELQWGKILMIPVMREAK